MHAASGHPGHRDQPVVAPGAGRVALPLRALAWLLTAAALAGTFWLYTRPNLLLDLGSFMQMCGFL
jgi:hypothetical protein